MSSNVKKKVAKSATQPAEGATLTYQGQTYQLDSLSTEARQQANNIQVVERHLQQLGMLVAITETARSVESQQLAGFLPEKPAAANRKKDTVKVNDVKYALESFSEEGQKYLALMQSTQQRLQQLQADQRIAQTARLAYIQAFEKALKPTLDA